MMTAWGMQPCLCLVACCIASWQMRFVSSYDRAARLGQSASLLSQTLPMVLHGQDSMPQNDIHWLNNTATWIWKVRLGEKETLESTLGFFDDRIERLSDLEYYQVRPDSIFTVW